MKLLGKGELKPAGGIVGAGFDALVGPGRCEPGMSYASKRSARSAPSKSRPSQGLIEVRTTTLKNGPSLQARKEFRDRIRFSHFYPFTP